MLSFRLICRYFVLMMLCIGAMSPAMAARAQDGQDTDYNLLLFSLFRQTAFDSEFDGGHRKGRLVKWTTPIRAQIFGDDAVLYREEVIEHLRLLNHLTGVPIEVLDNFEEGANFRIHLLDSAAIRRIKPGVDCYAELRDINFEVVKADVYIVTASDAMRRHCIAEELTQSMGLTNDAGIFSTSIFNDHSLIQGLRAWDSLMVSTLYNPALKPGMTIEQGMPIAKALLRRAARWKSTAED